MKSCWTATIFMLLALFGFGLSLESALCQSQDAQTKPGQYKRLILKDGSFELISQYSIQGDRVRYFSAERYTWEELPYLLIDWAATEQYARQAENEASGRKNEAIARASEERKEEDAHMPRVAPGLILPSAGGVFLLDAYKGKSELNSLAQSEADLNKNTRDNILRGVINPIASSKQTIELKGLHARIQSHDATPVIYYGPDADDPLAGDKIKFAKDRFRIVRCENKKGNRIIAVYNIAVYGKVNKRTQYIEAKTDPVSDYWVRMTPSSPLQQGEYALIEFDNKGAMNLFVWDFGVDPAAPPNPAIEMPIPERKEPSLIRKPSDKTNP